MSSRDKFNPLDDVNDLSTQLNEDVIRYLEEETEVTEGVCCCVSAKSKTNEFHRI